MKLGDRHSSKCINNTANDLKKRNTRSVWLSSLFVFGSIFVVWFLLHFCYALHTKTHHTNHTPKHKHKYIKIWIMTQEEMSSVRGKQLSWKHWNLSCLGTVKWPWSWSGTGSFPVICRCVRPRSQDHLVRASSRRLLPGYSTSSPHLHE